MKNFWERGSIAEGLLTLTALSIVIFAILLPASARKNLVFWPGGVPGNTQGSGSTNSPAITSASKGVISLSTGNARYITDPMDEYVVLENRSGANINITGWRLENGKSSRRYVVGSGYSQFASDIGVIPQGTKIISPDGTSRVEDVILKPNERAIIVSGGPQRLSPYTLVSFKENACTAYLTEDYSFPSGHEESCIRPTNEVGYNNLDTECKQYVNTLWSCHTPKYDGLKNDGSKCAGCVDGREGLSSMCVAYIKDHFDYPSCINNHKGDKNFEGRVWHLYLYRPWEMWADRDETISLYDKQGNLISTTSY